MAHPARNERAYKAYRRWLANNPTACHHGCGRQATSPDHHPPLDAHTHIAGTHCCVLLPACLPCQARQGAQLVNTRRASGYTW